MIEMLTTIIIQLIWMRTYYCGEVLAIILQFNSSNNQT